MMPAAGDGSARPPGDWKAARNRHAARQLDMRQRRDRRELARQLQERYEREAIPPNDAGPPPRID